MAGVSRFMVLLLLLLLLLLVEAEGFSCAKSDQPSSRLNGWMQDEDTVLGEMKSHWMKQQLLAICLSHDMFEWVSAAYLNRKSTIVNVSSITRADDDDDKGNGAPWDIPPSSIKEYSAETWVRIPSVVTGDSIGAELMAKKFLRQTRRRNNRRRERRRRRKKEGNNDTDTWTSEPTNRSPNFGSLLTLGSIPSDTEGSLTLPGPPWLVAQGSRGIRSSLLGSEGLREETVKKSSCPEVREGRMRGTEGKTDERKGKKTAEKQKKRIKGKKGKLKAELILPSFQQ